LVLEEALPVLAIAMELGLTVPEAGFEICDADGQVLSMAELAWENESVALLLEEESLEPFGQANWNAAYLSEIKGKDDLLQLFEGMSE